VVDLKLREGARFPIERLGRPLDRPTVVFFYPVAFTGGCTREVRRFNDLVDDFDRAGVAVLGASVDEPELNSSFCEAEGLRYDLVSDAGKELAEELGLLKEMGDYGMRTARYTYLLDPDGTILRVWEVGPGDAIDVHPDEVLEAVQQTGGS
jgi:peroxiredoxin Q/BCP